MTPVLHRSAFPRQDRGVSSIEMPFVFALFVILMVGVFEVANYVQMASTIKNHATTMTITIAHTDVPRVRNAYPTVADGLRQSMQKVINETGRYLQEYGLGDANDSLYKVIAQVRAGVVGTVNVTAGQLQVGGDNFEAFRRPNECNALPTTGAAAAFIGVVHTQICIDFRSRIGKVLGAFSPNLAVICRSACMIMVSQLEPGEPPCTGANCYTSPGDAPEGGGGCENGTCRMVNKITNFGYHFSRSVCGTGVPDCSVPKETPDDDYYHYIGEVAETTAIPVLQSYTVCGAPVTTDCTGQCDCSRGAKIGAIGYDTLWPQFKGCAETKFIELGKNACNTEGNDKGYTKERDLNKLPDITWQISVLEDCPRPAEYWYDCNCGEYGCERCCSPTTVPGKVCKSAPGPGIKTPPCREAHPAYDDCCEGDCGENEDEGTGRCTKCKGKEGNNHCRSPGCQADFTEGLCGN